MLVLSAHVEVEQGMELMSGRGGVGYLQKSRVMEVEDLLDAVERVAEGPHGRWTPIWCASCSPRNAARDPLAELTAREREVLALMAEGRSNGGIAKQLWLAGGTVEKHVQEHPRQARHPGPPTTTTGACWPCSRSSAVPRLAGGRKFTRAPWQTAGRGFVILRAMLSTSRRRSSAPSSSPPESESESSSLPRSRVAAVLDASA